MTWLNFEPIFEKINESMTNLTLASLWDNATGLNVTVFSPTCDSSWFKPVVGITSFIYFILSVFAMAPNLLFIYAVGRSKLLHPNVRILLVSLTVSCVVTCISLLLQSIYNFLLLSSGDLKQPITTRACAVMQNMRFTTNHVTLFTLMLLSMERLISTNHRFSKIKHQNVLTVITCALAIGSWMYALIFTFYDWLPNRGEQYGLCYCENSLNFAFYDLMIYVMIYVMTDFVALTCFWLVYKISRRALNDFGINTAHHSLTGRFQIWHNIRMIEMLLPSVAVHVICLLTCVCVLAICVNMYQTRREGLSLTLLQPYYLVTVLHATAHPLICIRQNAHIGKAIVRVLKGRCGGLFVRNHSLNREAAIDANPEPGIGHTVASEFTHAKVLVRKKKPPLLRNTVGYKITPEQHQKLMATIWENAKQPVVKYKTPITHVTKV